MLATDVKISIIIPVYNSEKYLEQCLDSVINQSLKDIEIICINDGSTDESYQILEDYSKKDNRIIIISQDNQGISVARNQGIKKAVGEYIAFLDSDDYMALDYCEKLYNRGKETNSDIVVCENIYSIRKKKIRLFLKMDKNIETCSLKEKFECLYLPDFCYVWNKIYKRESIKNIQFKGMYWEDIYYTCEVLELCNKLSVATGASYYYRFNNNSVSRTYSNAHMYFYYKALAFFYDFMNKHELDIDVSSYRKVKKIKILGIPVFKTKRVYFKTQYYIFNIMFFSRITIP